MIVAIERLGCNSTRSDARPVTTSTGIMPRLNLRISSPFRTAILAAHTTITNRASSEGWNLKAPMPIQLLVLSAVPEPVPITRVAASSTSVIT